MGNYNFDLDLAVAKHTERKVAEYLENRHNVKVLEIGDTNKYDILAVFSDGEPTTIEVKEDFKYQKTGNIAVEFECRGKPSGIETTEAVWYIYVVHIGGGKKRLIMQKTETLKRKIENKQYFRMVVGGDEGSNTMNYLFKYYIFAKDSFII